MLDKLSAGYKRLTTSSKLALNNSHWLLFEKAISLPVALLINILLARHLGVTQLGEYSYLLSLVYLISPLSLMGLSSLITKELVNQPENEFKILGASLLGRILGGFIGLLCLSVYCFFGTEQHQLWIILLAVAQVFSCFSLLDFWFQAKVQIKYSVTARLITLFIFTFLRIALIFNDTTLQDFIVLYAIEVVVTSLMYIVFYQYRSGQVSQWQLDIIYCKKLLMHSFPLIFSGVAAVIYLKIDTVMLSKMVDNTEVGLYAVASRLSEIWYFIPGAIVSSFFPMLLKARQSDHSSYNKKLQKLCDALLLMSVVVIIPVLLLAEFIVTRLYGEIFSGSVAILKIHIFAGIFIFMRALLSKWLIAEELLKFSLVTQGLGASVNVILNMLLIPSYGGVGAAWATLISYATASYLSLFMSVKTRPMAIIMSLSFMLPFRLMTTAKNISR